jgi:prophage tail gpP-like protein
MVKGMSETDDFKSLVSSFQLYGTAIDSVVSNTKRKHLYLSDTELDFAKAKTQAKNIRNIKAGYSRPYILTVKDWEQLSGNLWEINSIVTVDDSLLRVKKQLLIYQIDYRFKKSDGWESDLYLIDKNTYTSNDTVIKSEFDR